MASATFPARLMDKFGTDNGPTQAVSIAWNALQSIFPIALLIATVLGLVLSRVGVTSDAVYRAVVTMIPDPVAQSQALDALEKVQTKTGLFALLGVLGFIWSGSNLIGAMEQSFDLAYGVPMRSFLRQRLVGVGVMFLFVVLAGMALGTAALLPAVAHLPGLPRWLGGDGAVVTQIVIGALAGSLIFLLLYYVVPNRAQRLSQVWPGAVIAGCAFEALVLAFPIYLQLAGGNMNQYGKTFGLLFIVMLFFYVLGLITVFGLEINVLHFSSPVSRGPEMNSTGTDST
ncbi:MAG: YihY/virulence factor BrkB family protein [Candidatus Dormibacteraceae bacterium]